MRHFLFKSSMKTSIEFTLIAGLTLLVSTLTNFGQSNKKEKTPKHNQLTQKEITEGWKLLFNGEEIKSWRYYNSPTKKITGWTIDNGNLHKPKGIKAGNIMTSQRYENFIFSWEWKLESLGNNGVKYFLSLIHI